LADDRFDPLAFCFREVKMQGIIIENISNLYKIKSDGKIYEATAKGKFKQEELTPLVGDNVEFEILKNEENKAVISKIQTRKTEIKRPKVANITQLIFVVSTQNPKPDLLMLDKQLAYSEFLGIKPIIIINKIDLKDEYKKIEEVYKKAGYTTILTCAKEGKGIDKVQEALKGNISAFSGISGVGKSTIINALFKKDVTQEGEVSKKNKRGKNTTTVVKLYELEENTYIVDTPGFSNFELAEIQSKDLQYYFIEFRKYIDKCEFVGCTHIKENNCGIKEVLKKGKISQERYERFCKIYAELKEKEERKW